MPGINELGINQAIYAGRSLPVLIALQLLGKIIGDDDNVLPWRLLPGQQLCLDVLQ